MAITALEGPANGIIEVVINLTSLASASNSAFEKS
jgi:hypothetical protein